jgi:hypothetical protein
MKIKQEPIIQYILMTITFVMVILRFLMNEKGRTSPDSILYFRTAKLFPIIDNTTTPLGYPLFIKFFGYFSDEFWASKIIGLLAYLFLIYFAWKKKFYFKEIIITAALYSYVSIFSFSMSEALILPVVFIFIYLANQIIIGRLFGKNAIIYLSLILIAIYNIRYSGLFFTLSVVTFGVLNFKKIYAKTFIISGLFGPLFIALYQVFFINYFNQDYYHQFLEIGVKPTSQLLVELYRGLCTSFNPFIHIANPNGGIINYGIYGIGALNIIFMLFLFIKYNISASEKFLIFTGLFCVICSYFIQYIYSVNALDYGLLSPFIFSIWLVYFKKLFQIFGVYTYLIAVLSLLTGFVFTWLSRGNYLENRKKITQFLKTEKLDTTPLKYYLVNDLDIEKNVKVAELISTVNPRVTITFKPKDTLQVRTLTSYKVMSKIKISKNKFQ